MKNGHKGKAAQAEKSADFRTMRAFILSHLSGNQVAAFNAQVAEAAAVACDTEAWQPVRELLENWEATAEIYAIPGEAEKILEYIREDEATRQERSRQGEWDWQTEKQAFLQSLNSRDTPSVA